MTAIEEGVNTTVTNDKTPLMQSAALAAATQELYDSIMAAGDNPEVCNALFEAHFSSLDRAERERFESWFASLNSLIPYANGKGYSKQYAWIIYTTDNLEEAEEYVGSILHSSADLNQYFIAKGMPFLQMSENEFGEALSEHFASSGIACPEQALQVFIKYREKTSFIFSLSPEAEGMEEEIHSLGKEVDRFRYSFLKKRISSQA